jgi:hypothetical protein
MSIALEVLAKITPILKNKPHGLTGKQVLSYFTDKYNMTQIRGGLETNVSTGRLRKIQSDEKTVWGPAVGFTLPGLPLTANKPTFSSQMINASQKKRLASRKANQEKKIQSGQSGIETDKFLELIQTRSELNRHSLSGHVTELYKVHRTTTNYTINRLLNTGKIVQIGTVRLGYLALANPILAASEFKGSDAQIVALVEANPLMSSDGIKARVASATGKDSTAVYNMMKSLVSRGLLAMKGHDFVLPSSSEAMLSTEDDVEPTPVEELVTPVSASPMSQYFAQSLEGLGIQIKALAESLADSIALQIGEQVAQRLASLETTVHGARPTQYANSKETSMSEQAGAKIRIAIAGLIGVQANAIAADFPGVKFVFIDTDNVGEHLAEQVKRCNRVYTMTKFVSHALEGKLRNHPNFVRINGGLSSLRAEIRDSIQTLQ